MRTSITAFALAIMLAAPAPLMAQQTQQQPGQRQPGASPSQQQQQQTMPGRAETPVVGVVTATVIESQAVPGQQVRQHIYMAESAFEQGNHQQSANHLRQAAQQLRTQVDQAHHQGVPGTQPGMTPGQSGATPGQSATTPGQSRTTPGQSATTPGQSRTTPGQSATTPGQSRTTPGQSATTPGQSRELDQRNGASTTQRDSSLQQRSSEQYQIEQRNGSATQRDSSLQQRSSEQYQIEQRNGSMDQRGSTHQQHSSQQYQSQQRNGLSQQQGMRNGADRESVQHIQTAIQDLNQLAQQVQSQQIEREQFRERLTSVVESISQYHLRQAKQLSEQAQQMHQQRPSATAGTMDPQVQMIGRDLQQNVRELAEYFSLLTSISGQVGQEGLSDALVALNTINVHSNELSFGRLEQPQQLTQAIDRFEQQMGSAAQLNGNNGDNHKNGYNGDKDSEKKKNR